MKDGTLYADRLKKAYAKVKGSVSASDIPELRDPVHCLALGILGTDNGPDRAERQLSKALLTVVDWNEIRVSNLQEVADLMGDHSADSLRRCQNLIDALQAVYDLENVVSLDRLKTMGRREARQYIESLKGVDEYAVAYVVLWALGGHAIPVCNQAIGGLRGAELVHPNATRGEIQAFLERNVSAADAKAFSLSVGGLAKGKAVKSKRAAPKKSKKRVSTKK